MPKGLAVRMRSPAMRRTPHNVTVRSARHRHLARVQRERSMGRFTAALMTIDNIINRDDHRQ